jgi:glycosyltransferase involved in cell wall biosynthesis
MFGLFIQRHAEAAALFNKLTVVYTQEDPKAERCFEICRTSNGNFREIIVYYKKSNGIPLLSKLINQWRFFRANLTAVMLAEKEQKFDLIHVHILTRLGLLGWFLAFRRRIPYLITEHWSRYLPVNKGFNGFFRKWVSRFVVKRAAMVTTVTNDLMLAMQSYQLKNQHYTVLPNVVDMELFQPLAKPQHTTVNFVHISCFEDKSKNISGLLRAIGKLSDAELDFSFTLIGDGMDFDWLKAYANELKISEKINFTGLLQGIDLAKKLAQSDVLVLFSNYENMPVVILEALACGIPVVATRVGGIPEMIDKSNGMLVDAGDESGLADALISISKNYQNYDAAALRGRVAAQYSMKAVGQQLDKWYDEILLRFSER